MHWTILDPRFSLDHLGALPYFFDDKDPRPASAQLDANYAHGGGFSPWGKDNWKFNPDTKVLKWPGDTAMRPLACAQLREETLIFYQHAILLILQPNGSFLVTRVD